MNDTDTLGWLGEHLRQLDAAGLSDLAAAVNYEQSLRQQNYEAGQILAAYDHARDHSEELDTITLWRRLRSGLDLMGLEHPAVTATSLVIRLRFGLI